VARGGYFISDDKSPWQEVYATKLAASLRPTANIAEKCELNQSARL
jgi:hypothetical protein